MAKQALLHFKNVKKSFSGNVVLSGVDFEIFPGQIVALAGENGAGKSTLMNIWNECDTGDRRLRGGDHF